MRKWSVDEYRSMPWKNGGGVTTELAIYPDSASLEHFIWRLSAARINQDGPFSHFAGIDRTLAVLAGDGLTLHSDSSQGQSASVSLNTDSRPYSFAGEVSIRGELHNQVPVLDLNMMTRRDVCAHSMQRLEAGQHLIEANDTQQLLLYCASGSYQLAGDTSLQAGELLMLEEKHEHEGIRLVCSAEEGSRALLILIRFLNMGQG